MKKDSKRIVTYTFKSSPSLSYDDKKVEVIYDENNNFKKLNILCNSTGKTESTIEDYGVVKQLLQIIPDIVTEIEAPKTEKRD